MELDERFQEERNKAFISKWIRRPLKVYDSFDLSLEGLKSFFENAKVHCMLVYYNYLDLLQGLVVKELPMHGQLAAGTLWHKYSACDTEFGYKWA